MTFINHGNENIEFATLTCIYDLGIYLYIATRLAPYAIAPVNPIRFEMLKIISHSEMLSPERISLFELNC